MLFSLEPCPFYALTGRLRETWKCLLMLATAGMMSLLRKHTQPRILEKVAFLAKIGRFSVKAIRLISCSGTNSTKIKIMENQTHRNVLMEHEMNVDGVRFAETKELHHAIDDESGQAQEILTHSRWIDDKMYAVKTIIFDDEYKKKPSMLIWPKIKLKRSSKNGKKNGSQIQQSGGYFDGAIQYLKEFLLN